MIYDHVRGIRDLLKQDLALEFCRNQNQLNSILTKTPISYDQIHNMRNNWLGSIFSSSGDSYRKGLPACLIWILKLSLSVALIQMRCLGSLRVFPLMTSFSVFIPPSGYGTKKQLGSGRFFEGLQNYMENENDRSEKKNIWRLQFYYR